MKGEFICFMFLDKKTCTCSNCRKMFSFDERQIRERKIVNVIIKESVCPFCGSSGYTQEAFEKWLNYKYENLNW